MKSKKVYLYIALYLFGFTAILSSSGFQTETDHANHATTRIDPKELLNRIVDPSRYITVHDLARRLIEGDPSVALIDVRTMEEYIEYSIPGAMNISGDVITQPEYIEYIDREGFDVIFYSNGDVYSEQAWMLFAQQGVTDIYVLKGGLNEWFGKIIQPVPPPETAGSEARDQYSFELAASIYFGGTSVASASEPTSKKQVVVRKKEKKAAEGGC